MLEVSRNSKANIQHLTSDICFSMSEPEILLRCPECGASVRAAAHFCPQCGHVMNNESAAAAEDDAPPVRDASLLTLNAKPDATRRPTPKAASLRLPYPERSQSSVIVKEDSRPRIEQLREASLDVLEEASEDSGLRFVLVAFTLFLLFLLCLFISIFLR